MVMSWVAEAVAMTSPIATTPARFALGSTMLHATRHARITDWSATIQARRCPSRSESQGRRIRSMSGAQRKLKAYTPKMRPAQPMVLRLKPSSLSQRLRLLPIRTQGKPLMIPSSRIRAMRRSK